MGAPSPVARFQEADAATRDAGAGKDADDADDSPRFEVEFDDDDDVTTTAAAEARTPGGGHALFESFSRVRKSDRFEELQQSQSSFRRLDLEPETPKSPTSSRSTRRARRTADSGFDYGAQRSIKLRDLDAGRLSFREFAEAKRGEAEDVVRSGAVSEVTTPNLPVERMGNLALYTDAELEKRVAVEKHPRFAALCRALWALVERDGYLERADYLAMVVRFNYVVRLCPKNVGESAARDWVLDGGELCGRGLAYREFVSAVWEAVDVWTETSEVPEYVALLERLIQATTLERFDGALAWRSVKRVRFDAYFAVAGDERKRADAAARRGDGYDLNERFGAAVFVQRAWIAKRERRAAIKIQTQYRLKAFKFVLTPLQTNQLVGKLYAKQIHLLAANRRSRDPVDRALRFDAFCLRFFKSMNGSAERAHAYLKVFIKSCETVLQGGDARSSARVAVFAELVGIAGDHFNGRLFHEYVLKVLADLYTEREATAKLANAKGNAEPVDMTKMRRALWRAMPEALRRSDAVKARVRQAVAAAAVGRAHDHLCDPDVALSRALGLYKAADLWHALRRKRAASVLGLYVKGWLAAHFDDASRSRLLEDHGRSIAEEAAGTLDPAFAEKLAAFERMAPARRPKRRMSCGDLPRKPSLARRDARRRGSLDGLRRKLKSAPVKSASEPRGHRPGHRKRASGFDGKAPNRAGKLSPGRLFSGVTVSPKRKLDEALWRDLELNGGTGSLLYDLQHKAKGGLLHALQVQ